MNGSSPPPLETEDTKYKEHKTKIEQDKDEVEESEREILLEQDYSRRYRKFLRYDENDSYAPEDHSRSYEGKRRQPFFQRHPTVSPYHRQRDEYTQERLQKMHSFPDDKKYPSNTSSPISMATGFSHHSPYASKSSQQQEQQQQHYRLQRENHKQQNYQTNAHSPPLEKADRMQRQQHYYEQQHRYDRMMRQTVKIPSSNRLEMNLEIIDRTEDAIKICLVMDGVKYSGTLGHQ